ncbi:MAG TPA: HlyD family efflux transporter periplasmic adaptor subunit [Candidatus Paceibacterota bacterium]|nr:HlyD family efflux transporter periplasmic adaptor subunit [Candidatus Paceibacterota bacterium]
MSFTALVKRVRAFISHVPARSRALWTRYRGLKRWQQIAIAVLLAVLVIGGTALARSGGAPAEIADGRMVTLATVGELSGTGGSVDLIGSVRSITEANILAKNGGTVTSVRVRLGGSVPAGSVIAELENAAERASVLQAEGAYDAAVAARNAQSLPDTQDSARDVYRSVYTSLDTTIENDIDTFFGGPTPSGPNLLIYPDYATANELSRERARIEGLMDTYESNLVTASSRSPQALLDEAESTTRQVQTFLNRIAESANQRNSRVTAEQTAALATARVSVNSTLSTIASARSGLRSGSVSATAGADASVKQALGSLRAAQANLERTVVRAPIGGTVNFLPIRVGDYVTPMQHVATVAQNGALEIVAYISEDKQDLVVAGGSVMIDGAYTGIITSVSPALDPVTKQIEVRVAVTGATDLVNGQSVHISLPDLAPAEVEAPEAAGPLLLPLSAVKLRAGDRIVFSVGEDSRLVAHPVTVGEVRGDRIEVTTDLATDLRIVADARGLAEGEEVRVASETGI